MYKYSEEVSSINTKLNMVESPRGYINLSNAVWKWFYFILFFESDFIIQTLNKVKHNPIKTSFLMFWEHNISNISNNFSITSQTGITNDYMQMTPPLSQKVKQN